MAKEKVLIELEIEGGGTFQEQAEKAKLALIKLKEEQAALNKSYKDGLISQEQYAKQLTEIEQKSKAQSKAYSELTHKIQGTKSLTDQLKESTKSLKESIAANNPVLDQMTGGLASTSQGFIGMTKAAAAFIATPIGLILTALAAAFAVVKEAISRSEPALDAIEDVTKSFSAALDVLFNNLDKVGGFLVNVFTGNLGAAAKQFKELNTEFEKNQKLSQQYLDISRELEDREAMSIVRNAQIEDQIKSLIIASKNKNLTIEESNKLLEQAQKLEEKLARDRQDFASATSITEIREIARKRGLQQLDSENFDMFVQRALESARLSGEEKKQIADLQAARLKAATENLDLQAKLQNLLDANNQRLEERNEKDAAAANEKAARDLDREQTLINDKALLREQEREAITTEGFIREEIEVQIAESISNKIIGTSKKTTKQIQEDKKKQEDAAKQQAMLEQGLLNASFGLAQTLAGRSRGINSALAVIQTYLGASKAFTSQLIPGDKSSLIRAQLAAAIALAQGFARVAAINGVTIGGFAQGGLIKAGFGVPITRSNGDNILATVKTGEVILNERQQIALGGARTFRAIGVPGFAEGGVVGFPSTAISNGTTPFFDFNRLSEIVTSQKIQVAVEDINSGQQRFVEVTSRAEL